MKKLMMAAAIVCAAALAHAGSITWGNDYARNACDNPGDEGALFSGTVTLVSGTGEAFFNSIVASDYATALAAATVLSSATLGSDGTTLSSPSVGTVSGARVVIDGVAAGSVTAFMTAVDAAGNFYISEDIAQTITTVGTKNYFYEHAGAYDNKAYILPTTWQGDGWYKATTEVPEPTSGLLLLLGVAGLALRRRRA